MNMQWHLDRTTGAKCSGWLLDGDAPETPVRFRVAIDGSVRAPIFTADRFRADLLDAGLGNGRHAFELDMAELGSGALGEAGLGPSHVLGFYDPDEDRSFGIEFAWHCYDGRVDGIVDEQILGWAANVLAPELPISIDLLQGDVKIASAVADEFREDLENAAIGTGRHGFRLALSGLLTVSDGLQLRIRFGGTDIELPGSPVTLRTLGLEPVPSLEDASTTAVVATDVAADAESVVLAEPRSTETAPIESVLVGLNELAPDLGSRLLRLMRKYRAAREDAPEAEAGAVFGALLLRLTLEQAGLWESGLVAHNSELWRDIEPARFCFDHRYFGRIIGSSGASSGELWRRFREISAAHGIVRPNHLFDEFLYVRRYLDVHAECARGQWSCGLDHYVQRGLQKERSPSVWFEPHWYRQQLANSGQDLNGVPALIHFLLKGAHEFSPSAQFDTRWYSAKYDRAIAHASPDRPLSPMAHYLLRGAKAKFASLAMIDENWIHETEPRAARAVAHGWIRSGAEWDFLFNRGTLATAARDAVIRALRGRNEQLLAELSKVYRELDGALTALQAADRTAPGLPARSAAAGPPAGASEGDPRDSEPAGRTSANVIPWRRMVRVD